ncbi:MAG: UDP-N-acetylmuramoyl-L-alanine--D-glutamate ligase, partial [Sphingomonadales bacterium]|nr:UDP-N-acetylmuramoyl-L-alanine--D-glutamate ligase [Sphingomonadales bacterium]
MRPSRAFAGKRYAVLGLARSGLSAVEYLWNSSASVTAWDDREEARDRAAGKATIADPVELDLSHFDAVVVSPGVPLNTHPLADKARKAGTPLIGDIELFARARPELPPHKVVGITGTNGKSTTAALTHHILETAGIPARLGGNIGNPILSEQELPEGGVYVLELSSFQIDLTRSLDCEVALLLNITPDHLDRYDDFEAYAASKARLFEMQSAEHLAIIGIDDEPSRAIAAELRGNRRKVSQISAGGCMDQAQWPALQGPHNAQNALAAMAAARECGADEAAIAAALESFAGLPHRMERVADRNGILFVNDSKATNPTSTAPALAAFPAIHWILGGQAKTDDLAPCEPHFDHVRAAYTIGESAAMFERLLTPHMA